MTARGIFDLRLEITADTEAEAWSLAKEMLEKTQAIAPTGVNVRWYQLRPRTRSHSFQATMTPKPKSSRQ
jgi:hypothetical protein